MELFIFIPIGIAFDLLAAAIGRIIGQLRVGGGDDVRGPHMMQIHVGGIVLLFHKELIFFYGS